MWILRFTLGTSETTLLDPVICRLVVATGGEAIMFSFRRRREIKNKIQSYFVASPCSVSWSDMTGDEAVRYCGECKLNIHNLSSLSDDQVVALIDRKRSGERICTYFYRDQSGAIVTDNCPKRLKIFRRKLQICAASMLLALCWLWAGQVDAQGLVGAPIDPRYGQSAQTCMPLPNSFDTAVDFCRALTVLSVIVAFILSLMRCRFADRRKLANELICIALIPVCVHIGGIYFVNNFGGIGGGL